MEKDFQVGQSNELVKAGQVYDLHNQYDFAGLSVDAGRNIRLSFEPNSEHGQNLPSIVVEFQDVDYLELSDNFGASVVRELDEMGYKEGDEKDDSWLLSEDQATGESHLFFRFGNGHYIRVHARSGHLQEGTSISVTR